MTDAKRCTARVPDNSDFVNCGAPVLRADRCAQHLFEEVNAILERLKAHERAIAKERIRLAELETESG
jgi:hypothetical protein